MSWLFACTAFLLFLAAPADAASPLVRARLEPASAKVMVGEPARIVLDVLTPTWFLAPPVFPTIEVADALVVFEGRGINLNESIGGAPYAGIQREYLVYPMRPGRIEVPPIDVTIVFAIDAKPSAPMRLSTRPLSFLAEVPAGAGGLDRFVAARRLLVRQALEPQAKGLVVGDALRRTLTIDAEEAFAMMLPQITVAPIAGIAIYADPPRVEERAGERGAPRTARRVESFTYRFERAGDYVLPGIEVSWWDIGSRQVRKAAVPAITLTVAPAPPGKAEIPLPEEVGAGPAPKPSPRSLDWTGLSRLLLPLLVALAALVLAWPLIRQGLRRARRWLKAARRQRRDSEPWWFARVKRAAARGDAAETYRALLGWVDRCGLGDKDTGTLDALIALAGNDELASEVARLSAALYGKGAAERWRAGRLIEVLQAVRLRMHDKQTTRDRVALGPLNPWRRA